MCYSRICEVSHANFTIWESKIGEMDATKTTQVSWWKYSSYTYVYVPIYVPIYVPTYIAHLPTYSYLSPSQPRTKELPEGALARECNGLINHSALRHSRDVACSGHCSFALTNFSFCLTARNRIWLEWGLQSMRQQVHTLGATLDWLVDLIFIPKKNLGKTDYER